MSTLHIAFSSAGLAAALPRRSEGDAVLLAGDAVYASRTITESVYALEEDLSVRGVEPGPTVTVIDYAGMVALTERHHPLVSWRE